MRQDTEFQSSDEDVDLQREISTSTNIPEDNGRHHHKHRHHHKKHHHEKRAHTQMRDWGIVYQSEHKNWIISPIKQTVKHPDGDLKLYRETSRGLNQFRNAAGFWKSASKPKEDQSRRHHRWDPHSFSIASELDRLIVNKVGAPMRISGESRSQTVGILV